MPHGNDALDQVFDPQGIAKRARQFLEFQDFLGIGLFVDAVKRREAAPDEIAGDGAVRGEHELFDDAVRDVAFAAHDIGHALLGVEFDDRLGEIEIDRAVLVAAGVQQQSKLLHVEEVRHESGVAPGHLGVAFEDFVDVGVGHALNGADHTRGEAGFAHTAGGVEFHQRAHDQTVLAGIQRTDAVRENFREHGDGAVGEVDRCPAQARLAVERLHGANVMRHVSDVDGEMPAGGAAFHVDGVVEIARGFAVDGHNGQVAKVRAGSGLAWVHGMSRALSFFKDLRVEDVGQVVFADDDFGVHTKIARASEDFHDAARGARPAARVAHDLGIHDGAVELGEARQAFCLRGLAGLGVHAEPLAEGGRELFTRRNDDFVMHSRVVGKNHVATRAVAEETHDGGMCAMENAEDTAFGSLCAGGAADALDARNDAVAVHRIADCVAADVDVAVQVREGNIGDDEAIAIPMKDEPSAYAALFTRGGSLGSGNWRTVRGSDPLRRRRSTGGGPCETIPIAGEFLNVAAFLEFRKRPVEGAKSTFRQAQAGGDFGWIDGCSLNFQEMKDFIAARRHGTFHER